MKKIITVFFIAFSLIGCASVPLEDAKSVPMGDAKKDAALKNFTIAPDKAAVYIFLDPSVFDANTIDIEIDGKPIEKAAGVTYAYKEIVPGRHIVTSKSENTDSLEIDAAPGKLIYIWQDIEYRTPPRTELHLVNELDARRGFIMENKLAETNAAIKLWRHHANDSASPIKERKAPQQPSPINWNSVKEKRFDIVPFIGGTVGGESPTKNSTIKSDMGGFPLIGLSLLWHMDEKPFAWRASYYLQASDHTASNQDSTGQHVSTGESGSFSRTPLEAMAFYKASQKIRIGAGLRYVRNSQADIKALVPGGTVQTESVQFASTTGEIVEGLYRLDNTKPGGVEWWIGLRYVKEQYRVTGDVQNGAAIPASTVATYSTVDGSHVAFILYAAF